MRTGKTVTTTSPNFVDGVLAFISERRDALTELETSISKVQHLFGMPLPVESLAAPLPPPRRLAAPARAELARRRTARTTRAGRPDVERAVSTFLDRQKRPTTMAAVVAAAKVTPAVVRPILEAMVAAGTLVRTGNRASLRLGRPAVMGSTTVEDD